MKDKWRLELVAHYTLTEGSAEFGIGNHLVWAGLYFTVQQ